LQESQEKFRESSLLNKDMLKIKNIINEENIETSRLNNDK
jgi:hypothetical protein